MAKKLIEVALPLEKINASAAHEKMPGIGAHPRGLHLWWARRPFTAARAVIWASLVDDPSSHPDLFPTEEEQNRERQRLFRILENLVVWENSNNEYWLSQAKEEILKSTGGNLPEFLDPFAGGGAIPLEAQRLGLKAHAHDLNPVAVMINKAMIEIPPRFADKSPVNPNARERLGYNQGWKGASGLAEDVRYYGEWMKQEAFRRIGHLYPKVRVPREQGGGEATVIAWIWARTVKCPNPACGCEMPLVKSFDLCKKSGRNYSIRLDIDNGSINYAVQAGASTMDGTISRNGGICPCCGATLGFPYIRDEGKAGRMNSRMVAIVAEGRSGRIYLSADKEQEQVAKVDMPNEYPNAPLPNNPRNFNTPIYGLDTYAKLFTNRQLTALTTFSNLVAEAQEKAEADAVAAGMSNDHIPLREGGDGAKAYGEAIGVYLAFSVDRESDFCNRVCRWSVSNEKPMNLFARQAIPMVWDFPEVNVFSSAVGSFSTIVDYIAKCISTLPYCPIGSSWSMQADAQSDCGLRNIMISTDPPYYDNIGYADLSDFFYVWLRRSLRETYPELFSTMLVPKAEELIATPYRHDGSVEEAKEFFEDGMLSACKQIYQYAREDIPVTIYYAYKQSDSDDDGTASSGWETMLGAIINAGFSITGTWPMRTEQTYRSIGMGSNALASSIVLVCRKRPEDAPVCTRRSLIVELRRELKPALKKLQESNIAPVDLAQSAIGPGMGVFSRYRQVLEADGTPMSVRSALQIINQELDRYFNDQDSDIDKESRFCVELYTQCGFGSIKFGDADTLARAKNTSVANLSKVGVVYSQKGVVHLTERAEIENDSKHNDSSVWHLTQLLTKTIEDEGIKACAEILSNVNPTVNTNKARDFAYRLFTIADKKGWTQEAYAYNSLVTAWPDIEVSLAEINAFKPEQLSLSI